jgi:iron(III) transport system permease protein
MPLFTPRLGVHARRPILSADDWLLRCAIVATVLILSAGTVLPVAAFLIKSVLGKNGAFVGLANYREYFASPGLLRSAQHTAIVACISTCITVSAALAFAYALTRSCMPAKSLFRAIALIPLLAPSLLPAISLVYLFGAHGVLKPLLFGHSIYGPIGIVVGEVFAAFPHALLILVTALSIADARLYEASESLGASRLKTFCNVTLPGIKYALVSCLFVILTTTMTDFGVPKVIGGGYDVLATDVYKQVVGWQNFEFGAVIGVILLMPAVLSFVVDSMVRRRQVAVLSSSAVPYQPKRSLRFDLAMTLFCALLSIFVLVIIATAAFASIVKFWPYNLGLTLANYDFNNTTDVGWMAYWNSLRMSGYCALFGTTIIFAGAYLVEKARGMRSARAAIHFMAMMPMAVPGLTLGLAYVFFYNSPSNPLSFIYGTIWILVLSCIFHFYTASHIAAVTALKQMDREFEAVSASLGVSVFETFRRVTVPVCLPAILNIGIYLFIRAMTTVSVVVFLYSPGTLVASVAVMYLDDNGAEAPAAAMAMMLVFTSAAFRILYWLLTKGIERRTQAWRRQHAAS